MTDAEYIEISAALAEKDKEIEQLRRDRDLAIVHDNQPYPTSEAYEQVCKTLANIRAQLAEARNAALEEAAKEVCIYCRRNGAPDFVDGDYKWAGHRGKNGHGVYDCQSIAIRALKVKP